MEDAWAIHDLIGRVAVYLSDEIDGAATALHVCGWSGCKRGTTYDGTYIIVEETCARSNPFSDVVFKWEERADYVWAHFDRAMRRLTRAYRRVLFLRKIGLATQC